MDIVLINNKGLQYQISSDTPRQLEGQAQKIQNQQQALKILNSLEPFLTKHPNLGVAIVASSSDKIDDWYDWHFGYDVKKNEIYRDSPAY